MKKVIFLSSGEIAKELFNELKSKNCEIVLANLENEKINNFPDYDLGISFMYTHKIPKTEFNTPQKWINFHPGPLPNYRGRNIAYHAIMNKEPEFGSTIHYMSENFDEGEVIEVSKFPILDTDTAKEVSENALISCKELFKKYLDDMLIKDKIQAFVQTEGTYYKKEIIDEFIQIDEENQLKIRAISFAPRFYPKININGRIFSIVENYD
jgi:methionyl-tRNA formyltransferase